MTSTKFKTKVKGPQRSWPLAKVRAITINKIFLLHVETKLSVGTTHYSSPHILLFIYSTDKLLFINSFEVRKFQKLRSTKSLIFDNCSPTFGAWETVTIGHHCASITELSQLYIRPSFHPDKASWIIKGYRATKLQNLS